MLTIGITTYNRKPVLEKMAASLYASHRAPTSNIRIYDDCSSEFTIDFLKELFPDAAAITVREKNIRADRNTLQMYTDFLETGDQYLFNADADLIFNTTWMERGLELLQRTDGALSLFNTRAHPAISEYDDRLIIKDTVGAAGMLFRRDRVEEIVEYFKGAPEGISVDYGFCRMFKRNGVRIFCTRNSYVQHIGYVGQNTSRHVYDFGDGFEVDNVINGQALNDTMCQYLENALIHRNNRPKMKIRRYIKKLFPFLTRRHLYKYV